MFDIQTFKSTLCLLEIDDLYSLWDQLENAIANCKDDDTKNHLTVKMDLVINEHIDRKSL